MKTYNKIKKTISSLMIVLMLFSPLGSVLAGDAPQSVAPTTVAPTTETVSPQPARGVDESKLGPQNQETQPVQTPTDNTVPPTTTTAPALTESNTETSNLQGQTAENTNTGENSENTVENSSDNQTNQETNSTSNTENNIRGRVDTGGTIAEGERGNIAIDSGDAKSALSVLNLINSVFAGLGGNVKFVYKDINGDLSDNYVIDPLTGNLTDLSGNQVVINDQTGNNSENTVTNDQNDSNTNRNTSLSNLINNIDLGADTGNNNINNKVGDNNITTGNADISLNLLNFLNSTFMVGDFGVVGILNILGNWNGNLLLPKSIFGDATSAPAVTVNNSNTGANSTNNANSDQITNNNSTINNNGNIANNINLNGNTGNNTIDSNVGDSNIISGSVNLLLNSNNFANITVIGNVIYMAFVNVLGKWSGGDLIGKIFGFNLPANTSSNTANNNTGQNSENSANNSSSNQTTTTINNQGTIQNNVNVTGNTGNNSITSERGDSTIQTGDVNLLSNIVNFINSTFSGKRLVLLFINVFGDWNGNIDFVSEPKQVKALPVGDPVPTTATRIIQDNPMTKVLGASTKKILPLGALSLIPNIGSGNDQNADFVIPSESNQSTQLIDYISNNLNGIVFGLFMLYLISVALYLKSKSRKVIS